MLQYAQDGKTMGSVIALERVAVLVIFCEAAGSEEEYEDSQQNLKNLLVYVHSNAVLLMELLACDVLSGEDKLAGLKRTLECRLKGLQANKKQVKPRQRTEKLALLRKNNNIISSILQLQLANSTKEHVRELECLMPQDPGKLVLSEATPVVLAAFGKLVSGSLYHHFAFRELPAESAPPVSGHTAN